LRDVFIRQSWRSNYCGVYAAAMFLSLLGIATSRERARSLFGIEDEPLPYRGADLSEVGRVVRKHGQLSSAAWRFFPSFSFPALMRELTAQDRGERLPTILWFGIIHPRLPLRAWHTAVVTSVNADRINLLDPLAVKPTGRRAHNVSILPSLVAVGCRYRIDANVQAAALRWRPRSA
jgi:hypothetical protein